VLAYYALFVEERVSRNAAGLGVGLAYGTAILALAPITGGAANFARTPRGGPRASPTFPAPGPPTGYP